MVRPKSGFYTQIPNEGDGNDHAMKKNRDFIENPRQNPVHQYQKCNIFLYNFELHLDKIESSFLTEYH